MAKETATRRQIADRHLAKCSSSHQTLTEQNYHAAQIPNGNAVSGGLTPNGSPPSSSQIASGPSCPARTVEQSLNLLAISMSTLLGKVTQMQDHIVELQNDQENSSWAQLERTIPHTDRGRKGHSYFSSHKVWRFTYPACTDRTHYSNTDRGRHANKESNGPQSSPAEQYGRGP